MAIIKRVLFLFMFLCIYMAPAYFIHRLIIELYPVNHIKRFSAFFLFFGLIAFPLGSVINRFWINPVTIHVERFGGYFLFYYTYAILFLIVYQLLKLGIPGFKEGFYLYKNYYIGGFWLLITVLGYIGYRNAHNIRVTKYELESSKIDGDKRIVFFSDLHFSPVSRRDLMSKVAEEVNKLDADYVLIPGDIIDTDVRSIYYDYISDFKSLKSKKGVYASIGNHEYYGDMAGNLEYIRKSGVEMLVDKGIDLGDFYLIGRSYDYSPRKKLEEMLEDNTENREVIVMDHDPASARETIENNVFLQVSGHTHNGQFFPYNLVTKMMFKPDWGIRQEGRSNIITSCGLGYWAIPIRFPSYSELVVIDIKKSKG